MVLAEWGNNQCQENNLKQNTQKLKAKNPQQYNNAFMKYSALGSQMIGTLLFAAWGGRKLDEWLQTPKPYMTALCMLLGVVGLVVWLVRSLQADNIDNRKKPSP
ncbi:MAG: AtpZ/AtpI family protein [Cytophagales bacterium]|nr:MAG: AtpZ/AtpI family protein [Cytophagales bacterium]